MLAFSGLAPTLPSLRPHAAPLHAPARTAPPRVRTASRRVPSAALDPSALHHAASHLLSPDAMRAASALLADASSAATTAAASAGGAASAAGEAAAEAKKAGWWDSWVALVESAVVSLHAALKGAGVPGAYGLSIVLFTLVIKAITFPLNFKQMESTLRMQALSPRLKKIQADYKDNPAVLNQMTAQIYKDEKINPLAGCLPVFAQIPIWIALYRSVLNLASDNLLDEPFLWLPSLQGPVSKTGQGISTWLFPLVDGAPPIGWHDAICYLILPVILMASQFYSQKLISPPSDPAQPQQQQATNFLKFMPLLIGWFSLNVPSGLGVYWVTNNVLSTAQTVYIRSKFPDLVNPPAAADAPGEGGGFAEVKARTLDAVDGFASEGNGADGTATSATKSPKNKKRRKRR